jgi:hypothetical protein
MKIVPIDGLWRSEPEQADGVQPKLFFDLTGQANALAFPPRDSDFRKGARADSALLRVISYDHFTVLVPRNNEEIVLLLA